VVCGSVEASRLVYDPHTSHSDLVPTRVGASKGWGRVYVWTLRTAGVLQLSSASTTATTCSPSGRYRDATTENPRCLRLRNRCSDMQMRTGRECMQHAQYSTPIRPASGLRSKKSNLARYKGQETRLPRHRRFKGAVTSRQTPPPMSACGPRLSAFWQDAKVESALFEFPWAGLFINPSSRPRSHEIHFARRQRTYMFALSRA
jgi:hypothetical protein